MPEIKRKAGRNNKRGGAQGGSKNQMLRRNDLDLRKVRKKRVGNDVMTRDGRIDKTTTNNNNKKSDNDKNNKKRKVTRKSSEKAIVPFERHHRILLVGEGECVFFITLLIILPSQSIIFIMYLNDYLIFLLILVLI